MARKGHGRPVNLVDIGTYPDDGSSPCGSNEWNANRGTVGVMGFTKKTEAISSNNINITDSYVEVTNAGTIYTMAQVTTALSSTYYASDTSTKSFAEGDLLYLVKASGVGTVTLKHQNGGAGAGKITTLSGGDLLLDENIPRIFICRTIGANQEWIEYGGAPATTPTDITVADSTDTTCFPALFESATGDLAPKTDAGLTYNAGTGMLSATGLTGPLTGNASGSAGSCTGNSATVTTNANLTGDVTSSGNATTIATDAVDIAMLSATGTASSSTFLRGDNAWAAPGGAVELLDFENFGSAAASYTKTFSPALTGDDYGQFMIQISGKNDSTTAQPYIIFSGSASNVYSTGNYNNRTTIAEEAVSAVAPMLLMNSTGFPSGSQNFTSLITFTLNETANCITGRMETMNANSIHTIWNLFEVTASSLSSIEIGMTGSGELVANTKMTIYGVKNA